MRTGEPEPAPEAQRAAIRDVIRHCLYAVDKNPLAVDLCKVALWIEGHNTGRPLSFLDHHVKLGDSLIGVFDLEVLEEGIPDDAYKPLTGDDKEAAQRAQESRTRPSGRRAACSSSARPRHRGDRSRNCAALAELDERNARRRRRQAGALCRAAQREHDWARLRAACNLWTAAFFAKKTLHDIRSVPTTQQVWNALTSDLRRPAGSTARTGASLLPLAAGVPRGVRSAAASTWCSATRLGAYQARSRSSSHSPRSRDRRGAEQGRAREPDQRTTAAESQRSPLRMGSRQARRRCMSLQFIACSPVAFPLTADGDVNTYAIFAETVSARQSSGPAVRVSSFRAGSLRTTRQGIL